MLHIKRGKQLKYIINVLYRGTYNHNHLLRYGIDYDNSSYLFRTLPSVDITKHN